MDIQQKKELKIKAISYLCDYMEEDWQQNQDTLVNEFFEMLFNTDLSRTDIYLIWDFRINKFKIIYGRVLEKEITTFYTGCWDMLSDIIEYEIIPEFKNKGNFNQAFKKIVEKEKDTMKKQVEERLNRPIMIDILVTKIREGKILILNNNYNNKEV